MLEWIVFVIMILFVLYIVSFMKAATLILAINIILGILTLLFIEMDLKKKEMHNYYLISLVITAVMFILSGNLFKWFFNLLNLAKLNIFLQAIILMFVLPNLIKIGHKYYKNNIKKK